MIQTTASGLSWALGAIAVVVGLGLRTALSPDAVRTSYAGIILVLGLVSLVGAVLAIRRRVPDAGPWAAYGLGLGLSLLAGGVDTLLPLGDSRAGYLVVVLVGVPLVAWAVPTLLGLRHSRVDDVLDSALVAVSATFWAWELRFQPRDAEVFDLASLVPIGFVCFVFAVATLALLTGNGGHISRVRWMMSAGFALEAIAIIVSPQSMTGGRYAEQAVGTSLMLGGGVLLVTVLWIVANGYRPEADREPRTLRWWAPMTVAIISYVAHTGVRRLRPEAGFDPVELVLVTVAGLALVLRVVRMVRTERLLSRRLDADRLQLETLLHDVQDNIVIVDRDFVVMRQVGHRLEDGPGLADIVLVDFVHPEDRESMWIDMAAAARAPGTSISREVRLVIGGELRWIGG